MQLRTTGCESRRIARTTDQGCLARQPACLLILLVLGFATSSVTASPQWGRRSTQSAPASQSSQGGVTKSAQPGASPVGTDSAPTTSDAPAAAKTSFVQLATSMGPIVIELDEANAPLTCANFIEYVKSGFYDGTCFHRVVPSFVVQAGGFSTDLVQKPGREPIKSEWKASSKNKRGAVAMSRLSNRPDSATSQFFINVADNAGFDSARDGAGYTVFGRVVEGMAVVDKMSKVQTATTKGMRDVPVQPVVIEKAEWSAARPDSRAKTEGETVAATKTPGTVPGAESGSSSGTDSSETAPPVDPVVAARLDPTLWKPWGVAFSWAETPRDVEGVATAVKVSTEGRPGPNGATRCLVGPDEIDVPAGPYPVSVIARAGDLRFIQVALNGNAQHYANVDLELGVVTRKGDQTPSATVVPLGGGWYRIDAVFAMSKRDRAESPRRLLAVDDGDVEHHPGDTKAVGHFFIASPKSGAADSSKQ
jgi:peptidyl-prolyl cis-trans isomerase A (cyclophilin A)